MDIRIEELRRHYESLSDEALLEIKPEDLTPAGQDALEAELDARGLLELPEEPAEPVDEELLPTPDDITPEHEEIVTIATYDNANDARLAVHLLQSAQIPAGGSQQPNAAQIEVVVPARFKEQALEALNSPLSDEELAAQAEAAGSEDDVEEELER